MYGEGKFPQSISSSLGFQYGGRAKVQVDRKCVQNRRYSSHRIDVNGRTKGPVAGHCDRRQRSEYNVRKND